MIALLVIGSVLVFLCGLVAGMAIEWLKQESVKSRRIGKLTMEIECDASVAMKQLEMLETKVRSLKKEGL